MLRNPLKSIITNKDFFQHEILNKRAEQLSVADFVFITNNILEQ